MNIDKLKRNLGECKFTHRCPCSVRSSYEEREEVQLYIYDQPDVPGQPKRPVEILTEKGNAQLTVKNASGTKISLIKTDHCLLPDDMQKCDCVVFDETVCYLVEIKTGNNRNERRKEAIPQLENAIKLLLENGLNAHDVIVVAVICLKFKGTYLTRASKNRNIAHFRETYNVYLEEGNEISFPRNG